MAYKPIKAITSGRPNDVLRGCCSPRSAWTSTPLAAQTASKKAKVAEHTCGLVAIGKTRENQ